MAGSIQSPPFLSAYSTVEEAGRKYGREKRAICIRGLKWTRRGLEEVDKKGGDEDQERGEKKKRRKQKKEEDHEDLERREDHQGQALSC